MRLHEVSLDNNHMKQHLHALESEKAADHNMVRVLERERDEAIAAKRQADTALSEAVGAMTEGKKEGAATEQTIMKLMAELEALRLATSSRTLTPLLHVS